MFIPYLTFQFINLSDEVVWFLFNFRHSLAEVIVRPTSEAINDKFNFVCLLLIVFFQIRRKYCEKES